MLKINLIIHFFLEILHFKESYNLIGKQHFGPKLKNQNFARYGIGGEILITILISILDYFREKSQNFSKTPKKHFWGPLWALFAQIWANMNFPGKKGSVSF